MLETFETSGIRTTFPALVEATATSASTTVVEAVVKSAEDGCSVVGAPTSRQGKAMAGLCMGKTQALVVPILANSKRRLALAMVVIVLLC